MELEMKDTDAGGRKKSGRSASAWIQLAAGIGIIWLFMFWIGPAFMKLPGYSEMARFIDESGIQATAIYYTGVEEVGEATAAMRDRFRFPPEFSVNKGHQD